MTMRLTSLLLLLLWIQNTTTAQIDAERFQQKIDVNITVRLDDQRHFLHAFESITYANQSPDTLHYLYFHLWPNAYQHKKTAFARQKLLAALQGDLAA